MTCSRCWHIIGESYLCRQHGGEDGFTAGAYKLKDKPIGYPPSEDFEGPWFDFLDSVPASRAVRMKHGKVMFEEMVP